MQYQTTINQLNINTMKKILLLALPLMVMCFASCEKEEEWVDDSPIIQFKDPKFLEAALLNDGIDRNGDKQISEKEASVIEALNCSNADIRNMDEIKYFTSLTDLYCDENQLTTLDVSKNMALTTLSCSDNQLSTLDVSNNTALESLGCGENELTSLDISSNIALIGFDCSDNQLSILDISNNTALMSLWCSDNRLSTLDVSNNTALEELRCGGNQLTSLDLSNNTALTDLYCNENQLTSLNLSNNTVLVNLHCYSNDITSLDVSMCRGLTNLYCSYLKNLSTKLPLTSLKIYKYHILNNISQIEEEYGDIIEYVE